jgi:hypothetical protein
LQRIAQADVTNWIGIGPTSGVSGMNNWDGRGGVISGQYAPPSVLPTDPPFNSAPDPVVFKFGFVLSAASGSREPSIDSPLTSLLRERAAGNPELGHPYAAWFMSTGVAAGTRFYNSISTEPAIIHVVPAPHALDLAFSFVIFALTRLRQREVWVRFTRPARFSVFNAAGQGAG